MKEKNHNNIICSFCGISQAKADILIEGNDAYICNNCITKSNDVISESKDNKNACNDIDIKNILEKMLEE